MRLISGDCIEAMRELPDESVDAIVTDPPYGLGFMGKAWDDLPPGEEWGEACLRVLKPGGHLLAFGGSRTYHRLACAVEDAGFEVRDQMMWLYGSGFPKSLDVSKAIDRRRYDREQILEVTRWIRQARDAAGVSNSDIDAAFRFAGMAGHWTSAKSQPAVPTLDQIPLLLEVLGIDPADVPEDIARLIYELNGRKGQPGDNWFKREVTGKAGPLWESWEETAGGKSTKPRSGERRDNPATAEAAAWNGWGTALKPAHEPIVVARKPLAGTVAENVLRFGTGALNIDGCRVGTDGATTRSAQTAYNEAGWRTGHDVVSIDAGRWPANVVMDEEAGRLLDEQSGERPGGAYPEQRGEGRATGFGEGRPTLGGARAMGDTGGASRFFYCAKASKGEREAGLGEREAGVGALRDSGRGKMAVNHHPTVKPISLMRYLVRLVTPPEGTVLDPFLGSGTTGCAAVLQGFDFIGIEREPEYLAIAEARIAWWDKHRGEGETDEILKAAGVRDEIESSGQLGLLEEAA